MKAPFAAWLFASNAPLVMLTVVTAPLAALIVLKVPLATWLLVANVPLAALTVLKVPLAASGPSRELPLNMCEDPGFWS